MKNRFMSMAQKGFTLIELIITIVIIGVLAAVAIPKFLNLSSDAEKGVAAGVGAAIASGTSVNYARKNVPGSVACTAANTPSGCTYYPIATCGAITGFVLTGLADVPTGFTITGAATAPAGFTTGTAATCTVTGPSGATATFSAYGA